MNRGVQQFFSSVQKGDHGEDQVLRSIRNILDGKSVGDSYFLRPKARLSDGTTVREVDLVLLHPVLGVYLIEIKNWESLDAMEFYGIDPYAQVSGYRNILLSQIGSELGRVPINVEYRVVLPSVSRSEGLAFFRKNASYEQYASNTFFAEDLGQDDLLGKFFHSPAPSIPNNKEFLAVASLIITKKELSQFDDDVLPVITKDEVVFFDYKQLSILNGYTGGFRIIRGVAGTGKTVILTNFIRSRLDKYPSERFLILCFNRRLVDSIEDGFADMPLKGNIGVYSIFEFLGKIEFRWSSADIKTSESLGVKYEKLKKPAATKEFDRAFSHWLRTHPIDYLMCDETQDMPPNLMRVIYERIRDCVFFIDEAQRFYPYTMETIAEVFHHPEFEKIDMRGRVFGLKNVYRTPANIARCAFEVLSYDKKLNDYYRDTKYLTGNFGSDVRCVLEDGQIGRGYWDGFHYLKKLIEAIPWDEDVAILTHRKKDSEHVGKSVIPSEEQINEYLYEIGRHKRIKAMTFQSIKGLEAQTVVLHNLAGFLEAASSHKGDEVILFRKVYVLMTRAKRNLYISISEKYRPDNWKAGKVVEVIERFAPKLSFGTLEESKAEPAAGGAMAISSSAPNAPSLGPGLRRTKEIGGAMVVAAELFAAVTGLFG